MTMVPAERLAEVLVEVADTLVDEFDLIDFLHMVTTHTSELVHAQGAGILLADHHGRLQLMAASDERAKLLELFQLQADEGPCHDCFHSGTPVVDTDLTEAGESWPRFAPRAVAAGFRSVHAFPLRLRQNVIGALNLFGTEVGRMAPADVRVIQALADIATIGLLQERAIHRAEVLTEQLQAALNSRVVIEQAKGVLAQIHGTSTDEAFDLLRSYARSHHLRLGEVAQAVTEDPTRLPGLTESPRDPVDPS
jgi:transcriptional regulator with GAF, ATPase, and Fis domain